MSGAACARLARYDLPMLRLLVVCALVGCGAPNWRGAVHPPAATRDAAMPEVLGFAAEDLRCPAAELSWTCPDDICVTEEWPVTINMVRLGDALLGEVSVR